MRMRAKACASEPSFFHLSQEMGIETFERHFHDGGPRQHHKQTNSTTSSSQDGSSQQRSALTIAFLKCDKIPESARSKHGTYEQVLHNLFLPMMPNRRTCRHRPSERERREEGSCEGDDEGDDHKGGKESFPNGERRDGKRDVDEEEQELPTKHDEEHRERVDVQRHGDDGETELDLELETRTYDVVHKREYPTEAELDEIDAIVISGSFEDDSSSDTRWILRLAGFLISVHDRMPHIRIVGICFGLQIIARAFGPCRIIPNPKGWEIGSTKVNLSKLGKELIYGDSKDSPDHVMMQQIHADCAESCPEDFELLGWSDKTPIQAIAHLYDEGDVPDFRHSDQCCASSDPWRRVHIIAFQGHPEWHEDIIIPFIDQYLESGAIDEQTADEGRKRTKEPHDGDILGRAILKVLGVA
ncbi:hypothetical protein OIV83_003330 [Microbotryomycetes sp. JL201]|nr:hypothetical protein OIV83_003330 [Microbotryomycetes sp. JL201]